MNAKTIISNDFIALVAVFIAAMSVIISVLYQKFPLACLIVVISLLLLCCYAFIRNTKKHKPEPAFKYSKPKKIKDLPADLIINLPYSVNRTKQVEHIKTNLLNNSDKVWIIHGDRNQCHEPFLKCVKSIHWNKIIGRSEIPEPKLIPFICPTDNDNFDESLMDEIWGRIKNDNHIPDDWNDMAQLIDYNHDGPVILYTQFTSDDWATINNMLLRKLFTACDSIKRPNGYPLILCVFIIYEQGKSFSSRKKHSKRKKKIRKKLLDFKDFKLPMLIDISRNDIDQWQNMPLEINNQKISVHTIFNLQPIEIDELFNRDSLPMLELAEKLEQFL